VNRRDFLKVGALAAMSAAAKPSSGIALSGPTETGICAGESVALTYNLTKGPGQSLSTSFSVSGLPSGVTGTFSPTSCKPNCGTTLTLRAASNYVLGDYSFIVRAQNSKGIAMANTNIKPRCAIAVRPPPSNLVGYFVSTSGNDANDGSIGAPWAHCPGMAGWTGSASLASGDTVYFNSSNTFAPAGTDQLLQTMTAGVTYDGATWGGGTRAVFQAQADYINNTVILIYHSTTIVRGIDIDGNAKNTCGITVNWPSAAASISNIELNNCIVRSTGHSDVFRYGIIVGATGGFTTTNATVTNCTVHDVLHEGICLYPSDTPGTNRLINAAVTNCTVYNTGGQAADFGVGLLIKNYTTGATIEGNNFHNNFHGIQFENANASSNPQTGIVIRRNKIFDNLHWGIYILGQGRSITSDIYDNLIYDNGKAGQVEGGPIFFTTGDHAAGVWNILNNTIYSVNVGATSQYGVINSGSATGTPTITVKNNIIYTVNEIAIDDRKNWFTHSNNLAFRTSGAAANVAYNGTTNYTRTTYTTYEPTGISADPLFVNAFADFHLLVASPAIDAGATLSEVTTDYDGTARPQGSAYDIGAYEFS